MTDSLTAAQYASVRKRGLKAHVPESLVVNACMQWLWNNGCYVWRNNTGGFRPEGSKRPIRFGKVGSPDIIGMTPSGKFIGVECKSGKNGLTAPQEQFRNQIIAHNGLHVLARSIDDLEARKREICG